MKKIYQKNMNIKELKKKINTLPFCGNIVCFLVYGSVLDNSKKPNDLDAIIVVKEINQTLLNSLFKLLKNRYANLDINIYTYSEVMNNLSYFTREFKLEYLAAGVPIIGRNIFKKKFSEVNIFEYEQSMLIRSIERLQIVRQKFFLGLHSKQEKEKYIKKYLLRISKNILILRGIGGNKEIDKLMPEDISRKMFELGYTNIPSDIFTKKIKLEELYKIFDSLISSALISAKKDFDLKYKKI